MSRHPEVKWSQRVDKVFLTVLLADAKDAKVNLDPEGVFSFLGKAGSDNNLYEIKLELFDKVNVEESKINVGVRNIFCILEKAEKLWWKKLLRGDGKPPHYVKVDWDKWVDEDEDTSTDNLDMGGMDFSKFGGMGGGMGGDMDFSKLGGMGGGMDFSKLGGMGGGMGGGMDFSKFGGMDGGMDFSKLGGMGGDMGDMGEDFEDSDNEEDASKAVEEETEKKGGAPEEKATTST